MSKRAIILAGGRGTRLRPYTVVLPKPLMPIGDYPILEVIVKQLAYQGFTKITMAVNHQADIIKAFFGDGSKWGIRIDYSLEDQPLGTMGPLKILHDLPDNFLVMNGDILTDLNFRDFFEHHLKRQNLFTISSYKRDIRSEYGVLETDDTNSLTGFREKPVITYDVSMGVYMVNREALNFIPHKEAYGFDQLMLDMIAAKRSVAVKAHTGYWLDVGRPEDYAQAIDDFEANNGIFLND